MQGFKDVAGHEDIISHLQNAIKMNKVSHAYIFGGEHGSGKKLLASLFAMTLQCETHGIEPCMQCMSCKKRSVRITRTLLILHMRNRILSGSRRSDSS